MNDFFKALNDETRRSILDLLSERDLNAGEIADHFDISKPSISHHLDILRRAGLIVSEKKGQFVIYRLNTPLFEEFMGWMMKFKSKNDTAINKDKL
ncbi:MAG TPA: autorepressor SdpR family transcription factor, partial [Saprospiraceae bacterium]|nr:autorepressor SdpR family transcription factor [Saprospiraceae bacterium]